MNFTQEVKTTEQYKRERLTYHGDAIYSIIKNELVGQCKLNECWLEDLDVNLESYYYEEACNYAIDAVHDEGGLLSQLDVVDEVWSYFATEDIISEVNQELEAIQ